MTEAWVGRQGFCPNCGNLNVSKYPNNQPVADFFCSSCNEDYELKSKQSGFGRKVSNGAYKAKITRLESQTNPNLLLLNYDLGSFEVVNFLVVPKHFFVPDIIEKRSPLAATARRAGWVGSNIMLTHVPPSGKIFFVKNKTVKPRDRVLSQWQKTLFLREERQLPEKGWTLDVMNCVEQLGRADFTLADIYAFESELASKHPENRHVKDKIRQQLQFLRDKGYIEFLGQGNYRLV